MTWQKFSDRARESKKVRQSSNAAIVLWWACGNYCSEHGTDGFVPKEDIKDVFRPIGRRFNHEAAARECIDSGLLIDHGTHYEVHDYLDFNPSKEQVEERKERDAKRQAKYRARKKALEKLGIITRDETRDDQCDDTRDNECDSRGRHAPRTRDPVPTRPDPTNLPLTTFEGSAPPSDGAAPAAATKARKSKSAAAQALADALRHVLGGNAPALSLSLERKAAQRVSEWAKAEGGTLEDAARLLAASWAARGNGNAWKLCDVPFRATAGLPGAFPANQNGRLPRARATTAEDFESEPDLEEQLRGWANG